MEDNQLDAEKIKQEAIEASKAALIESLSGSKKKYFGGKDAPDNYDELFDEAKKQIPTLTQEDIDARLEAKLAEREDARKKAEEAVKAQQETELESKRKSFDQEWYDLVKQGKMPAVADTVQERINKGEALTMTEIEADEGLKARLELAKIANGKSAKVAFYEDYGKQAPGATAPVLGTRPATPQEESKELDYDEVHRDSMKLLGYR